MMHFDRSHMTGSIAAAGLCVLLSVTDGNTITCGGERIRLAGVYAPEIKYARCEGERRLGLKAKYRLEQLVAAGGVEIRRQTVRRGNWALARVYVNGADVGETLIREGLATPHRRGRRTGWCR
ncbi:MAG: thermonuclease family protein [Methyloligellaceae bacterium]